MTRRDDILVIGGGIVGLVAATDLAEAGAEVTLVDAGVNAGTNANAGSLHVQMQSRFMRLYPDQVARVEAALPLYRAAADEWEALETSHGSFDLIRKGGLMLAESADQMAFLEQKAAREARQGLRVEMLDRAALDRVAPWLGPQILGAELCLDEGKLNPLAANNRLRARADSLGVRIVTDVLRDLGLSPGGVVATGDAGRYEGARAVVAAAWGAGPLVADLGVTIPTRAEPLHMNITETCAAQISQLIQHAERSITLKQFGTGQIVIGGGWPARDRGAWMPPGVEPGSLLGNVALAARLVPGLGPLRVIRTWAGMNTTVDGGSVIGPLPGQDRVILAIPGDAGYTLGPIVARMAIADMIGRTAPQDPAPHSPARFAA